MTTATTPRPVGRPPVGTKIQIRLPDRQLAWLDRQAQILGVSRAGYLREMVDDAIRNETEAGR